MVMYQCIKFRRGEKVLMSTHIRRGFTLIEILVVIAIIAILSAILFPVFAKVREKARQTACLSNEKQLAMGLMQYTQDNDEFYPFGNNIPWGGGAGWAGTIYPYVKSEKVYLCPDDSPGYGTSYCYNGNLAHSNYPGPVPAPSSIAILSSPARTVMLAEVTGNSWGVPYSIQNEGLTGAMNSPAGYGLATLSDPSGAGQGNAASRTLKWVTGAMRNSGATAANLGSYQAMLGRHTDGGSYVLADGHVKWMRGNAVAAGKDYPGAYGGGDGQAGNCGWIGSPDNTLAAETTCSDSTIQATYGIL